VRRIDDQAIKASADVRFRSEYDYAVFEYWRSAKVLAYLERRGITTLGHVLDAGCGGGGMCVSFAEDAVSVVGIDLADRFQQAGTRLARERGVTNLKFVQADGASLPLASQSFDTVFSHSVIEHVARPLDYLRELRRVVKPGGHVVLQTAPYLSQHGSHLPRLRIPVPLYLIVGRRAAFATSMWLARHAPGWLDVPPEGSSFLAAARSGVTKFDDLLYKVTVRNLRANIGEAGFRVVREDLYISRLVKAVSARLVPHVPAIPLVRDVFVSNMEYLLTT
jgi:SAM-dependent methyltransferase